MKCMLVLSRKPGERIAIGENVHIVITRIEGGRVTIGIEAPSEVSIRRDNMTSVCPNQWLAPIAKSTHDESTCV